MVLIVPLWLPQSRRCRSVGGEGEYSINQVTDSHVPVKGILDSTRIYAPIQICVYVCREDFSMEFSCMLNVISKTQLDRQMVPPFSHHTNTSTMKMKWLIQEKAFNCKPKPLPCSRHILILKPGGSAIFSRDVLVLSQDFKKQNKPPYIFLIFFTAFFNIAVSHLWLFPFKRCFAQ